MKLVYVAGRITAPTRWKEYQNVRHAETVMIRLMRKGYSVICPHKNTENLAGSLRRDREEDFEQWIEADLEMLKRCDTIYMLKGWKQSRGAKIEHKFAKDNNIEIWYEEE